MDLNIDMETFYKVGIGAFSVIFLMGLINFFIFFQTANIFSKISSIAQLIFNIALILVFRMLLGTVENEGGDMGELLEEFKKKT